MHLVNLVCKFFAKNGKFKDQATSIIHAIFSHINKISANAFEIIFEMATESKNGLNWNAKSVFNLPLILKYTFIRAHKSSSLWYPFCLYFHKGTRIGPCFDSFIVVK